MNTKKIQLIAGILLIVSAVFQQISVRGGYNTKSHKTTMTIMASAMTILGILLIRKGTKKDDTSKPV